MKKLLLTVALMFSVAITAQTEMKTKNNEIPPAVKDAFAKEFPAKKVNWEIEEGCYEVEFKINGDDMSAVYDKKGNRKALEIAIKINQLPPAVLGYLKKNYPTSKITEAAKITDDKNIVTYEAEIMKNGQPNDVLFNSSGTFIKIIKAYY